MTRRGLTLVEVLAATVLLTVAAAALVPLLRDVRGVGEPSDAADEIFALALAADGFMRDLGPDQIESLATVPEAVGWPGSPESGLIEVSSVIHQTDDHSHAWITFGSGDAMIVRWIDLPEAPE